jgi:hypothetical protein
MRKPGSHARDGGRPLTRMMTAQKLAPSRTRRDNPTPVAGPFDFRLGIAADVDRIGVFLPGIAHGCCFVERAR